MVVLTWGLTYLLLGHEVAGAKHVLHLVRNEHALVVMVVVVSR